jgi:hypothetical protein
VSSLEPEDHTPLQCLLPSTPGTRECGEGFPRAELGVARTWSYEDPQRLQVGNPLRSKLAEELDTFRWWGLKAVAVSRT